MGLYTPEGKRNRVRKGGGGSGKGGRGIVNCIKIKKAAEVSVLLATFTTTTRLTYSHLRMVIVNKSSALKSEDILLLYAWQQHSKKLDLHA